MKDIIVGLIFVIAVYVGLSKKGVILAYILNFLYFLANYYLQNSETTVILIAKIFLVTAIITLLEYIAYQKAQSFFGYLFYILLMVVGVIVVIYLTKALFTFLGNPSILYEY